MSDTSQPPVALHRRRTGFLVTGAAGLLLSAVYLFLSRDYPFGTLDQPGARVWPTAVGIITALSSLLVLLEGWRMPAGEVFELPSGPGARRVVLMIVLLVAYFAGMAPLGNLLASAVFCLLFMRLVSPLLPWPRLAIASVGIAAGLHLLFVVVLKIPMPRGLLGF